MITINTQAGIISGNAETLEDLAETYYHCYLLEYCFGKLEKATYYKRIYDQIQIAIR